MNVLLIVITIYSTFNQFTNLLKYRTMKENYRQSDLIHYSGSKYLLVFFVTFTHHIR